jgi:hypothetical protein
MTTVAELIRTYGAPTREGPRVEGHERIVCAILWLVRMSADVGRDTIDRACATEIVAAYATGARLSDAAVEWASELLSHRGRWFHTHPWGPGHRAAIDQLITVLAQ